MYTSHGLEFSVASEESYKKLLINMIYKLLPTREEGFDWQSYLESLIIEIEGTKDLFTIIEEVNLIRILSKLNSLKFLTKKENFFLYRKVVFETINLVKLREVDANGELRFIPKTS